MTSQESPTSVATPCRASRSGTSACDRRAASGSDEVAAAESGGAEAESGAGAADESAPIPTAKPEGSAEGPGQAWATGTAAIMASSAYVAAPSATDGIMASPRACL